MTFGTPVDDEECWIRVITNTKHINKDGTISEQALKGKAISPPLQPQQWSHELSGRKLSLTTDPWEDGGDFVQDIKDAMIAGGKTPVSSMAFSGLVHAKVKYLRNNIIQNKKTDVLHTPLYPPMRFVDLAHADFVIYGATDDDLDAVRTALQLRLRPQLKKIQKNEIQSACDGAVPNQTSSLPFMTAASKTLKIVK